MGILKAYIYRSGERGGRKMGAGEEGKGEGEKKRGKRGSVRKPR